MTVVVGGGGGDVVGGDAATAAVVVVNANCYSGHFNFLYQINSYP